MKKFVIAHPAQQHSYKIAEALTQNDLLFKYITTVYLKKGSLLEKILKLLPGENYIRASNRRSNKIKDEDVLLIREFSGLILLFLQRIKILTFLYKKYWNYHNKKFNEKLYKYALANMRDIAGIIVFDQVSAQFFKKRIELPVIIDMSAPSVAFMKKNFSENGIDSHNYDRILADSNFEISNADFFIAASTITEQSLLDLGISRKQIRVFPYGIEPSKDVILNNSFETDSDSIRFLFVGRVSREKGIDTLQHLFDEIGIVGKWTFVGDYSYSKGFYEKYNERVDFLGHVPKSRMEDIYNNHDVLVFPSLADGFGLSIVEALRCGVFVICSDSSGAKDVITDGKNGSIFIAGSSGDLIKKILFYKNNKNRFKRNEISNSIELLTWERYNNELIDALKYFMDVYDR